MKRREFLKSRLAVLVPSDGAPDPAVHLRFSRRAMATTFEVILPFAAPGAHVSATAALDEIDRLEDQLTVYRDGSEVSRLNAHAQHRPMRVERNLFDLLTQAVSLQRETETAFDVAIGALIKAWGFYRRAGRVPSAAERQDVLQRVGSQHLRLDPQRQTVAFACPGLEINLGSIGKGYALDRALSLLENTDVLLHGGHSSLLARGRENPERPGWTVGLMDPEQPQCRRALVRLCDRAMATSAATYQHLEHEGRKLGHIVDPRTGWPAETVLSATVTAPTAAEADALATAFFILGVEKAEAYCAVHPEIGAALIPRDGPQRLAILGRAVAEIEVLR